MRKQRIGLLGFVPTYLITAGLLLAIGAAGCATGKQFRGRPIQQDRVQKIVKGKTTMNEVISMFGSPTEKDEISGTWLYTYKHTQITSRSTFLPYWSNTQDIEKSDVLTISFDENKVVETFYIERGL